MKYAFQILSAVKSDSFTFPVLQAPHSRPQLSERNNEDICSVLCGVTVCGVGFRGFPMVLWHPQLDLLSPDLFALYISQILRSIEKTPGLTLGDNNINNFSLC